MDLTPTIQANSDQLNADDLISGPVTVHIQDVVAGNAEQPVHIRLQEFPGKTYRPSKSMRRVMIAAWGSEAARYAGRRLELFRNPDIKFGRDVVGGIQISRMSDIDGPLTVALTVSRGKKSPFVVKPLTERDWAAELKLAGDDLEAVAALGTAAAAAHATPDALEAIRAKYRTLKEAD